MSKTIYEVLKKQHDEAKELLAKLASSSSDDAKLRRDTGHKVAVELITHHEAESKTFYRPLSEFDELRDHVEEHQEEHEEANAALKKLMETPVEDADWLEQLKTIKQEVEHHIEDEEERLFPEARECLDEGEAEKIAKAFQDEQKQRKQRMQPSRAA